jgi:hypothetical protein
MARAKKWQWDHFHQGDKANTTHSQAYCLNCVANQVKILKDRQSLAIAEGQLDPQDAKDDAALIVEGAQLLSLLLILAQEILQGGRLLVSSPESCP